MKNNTENRMTVIVSVIVIGLNEENLLADSISSILNSDIDLNKYQLEIIYVDSGSTDRSVDIAKSFNNVLVLHLNVKNPSAAKARNLGLQHASGLYVQLLDGDSVLDHQWLTRAVTYLESDSSISCVFGSCIEAKPDRSIYTKLCSFDWFVPPGEYRLCGGNAFWRKACFIELGGFDENLEAGEEPDFCYRVRRHGGKIMCIPGVMVKHDLEMDSFKHYWKRGLINGKAYATIGFRYIFSDEKLWLREMLRNFLEPILWLFILLVCTVTYSFFFAALALISVWSMRAIRIALKSSVKMNLWTGFQYGLHSQFIRIPSFWGQMKVLVNMISNKKGTKICPG